jgi:hypothetical protein
MLVVLLAMVVLLTNCMPLTHRQETMPSRPESQVLPAKLEVVREATKRALVNKNYPLEVEQGNALHLQTGWLKEEQYRSMVRADFARKTRNRTELTLQLTIQKKKLFGDGWEPSDKMPVDAYRILMGDIEMEVYRVLYDGP